MLDAELKIVIDGDETAQPEAHNPSSEPPVQQIAPKLSIVAQEVTLTSSHDRPTPQTPVQGTIRPLQGQPVKSYGPQLADVLATPLTTLATATNALAYSTRQMTQAVTSLTRPEPRVIPPDTVPAAVVRPPVQQTPPAPPVQPVQQNPVLPPPAPVPAPTNPQAPTLPALPVPQTVPMPPAPVPVPPAPKPNPAPNTPAVINNTYNNTTNNTYNTAQAAPVPVVPVVNNYYTTNNTTNNTANNTPAPQPNPQPNRPPATHAPSYTSGAGVAQNAVKAIDLIAPNVAAGLAPLLGAVGALGVAVAGVAAMNSAANKAAQYSGVAAGAKAQVDVNRELRAIRNSQSMGDSSARWITAMGKIEGVLTDMWDWLMKLGLETIGPILEGIAELIQAIWDWWMGEEAVVAKDIIKDFLEMDIPRAGAGGRAPRAPRAPGFAPGV